MQDLNDLRFFAEVVEQNGFAAAARKLGMPRSRLSRRIGLLEERLGVRLIQRSTRRFAVTGIGQEYYRHCVAMMVEADAAQETIDRLRAEPRGVVRVSRPSSMIYFQVGEMIARFMAECPKVEVSLAALPHQQVHQVLGAFGKSALANEAKLELVDDVKLKALGKSESTNRQVDVIREGFDIAIRVRFPPLDDSDLVIRKLAESTQLLVASPAVLKDLSRPLVPADLAALPSLAWDPARQEHEWRLDGPDGASAVIRHRPRFVTEDMVALRLAALGGVGICQFPTFVVQDDLQAGRLIDVLPEWTPKAGIIHAVFPSRRVLLLSVRTLLDYLAEAYSTLGRAEEARRK